MRSLVGRVSLYGAPQRVTAWTARIQHRSGDDEGSRRDEP